MNSDTWRVLIGRTSLVDSLNLKRRSMTPIMYMFSKKKDITVCFKTRSTNWYLKGSWSHRSWAFRSPARRFTAAVGSKIVTVDNWVALGGDVLAYCCRRIMASSCVWSAMSRSSYACKNRRLELVKRRRGSGHCQEHALAMSSGTRGCHGVALRLAKIRN